MKISCVFAFFTVWHNRSHIFTHTLASSVREKQFEKDKFEKGKVRKSKKEKENMFRQMSWKLESKISGMFFCFFTKRRKYHSLIQFLRNWRILAVLFRKHQKGIKFASFKMKNGLSTLGCYRIDVGYRHTKIHYVRGTYNVIWQKIWQLVFIHEVGMFTDWQSFINNFFLQIQARNTAVISKTFTGRNRITNICLLDWSKHWTSMRLLLNCKA